MLRAAGAKVVVEEAAVGLGASEELVRRRKPRTCSPSGVEESQERRACESWEERDGSRPSS
jgi:hypothetical protein